MGIPRCEKYTYVRKIHSDNALHNKKVVCPPCQRLRPLYFVAQPRSKRNHSLRTRQPKNRCVSQVDVLDARLKGGNGQRRVGTILQNQIRLKVFQIAKLIGNSRSKFRHAVANESLAVHHFAYACIIKHGQRNDRKTLFDNEPHIRTMPAKNNARSSADADEGLSAAGARCAQCSRQLQLSRSTSWCISFSGQHTVGIRPIGQVAQRRDQFIKGLHRESHAVSA